MVVHYLILTLGCHSNLCITWSCSHPSPLHLATVARTQSLYSHTESDQRLEVSSITRFAAVVIASIQLSLCSRIA